jgi:putative transposase
MPFIKQRNSLSTGAVLNLFPMCIDVYIGNVEGVERHTRKKKRASRKQAQKLSNWSFGKTRNDLAYQLAQHGIRLNEVDESYTSQTCPVCRKRKKVSGRMFACSCG